MKKEKQLEIAIDKYIKEKHTQQECTGFINGFNRAFNLLTKEKNKTIEFVKTFINIVFRIISLPIVFILILVAYFKSVFTICVLWVMFGREVVIFEKDTRNGVKDLINELLKKQ